jgi:hypothetical protein
MTGRYNEYLGHFCIEDLAGWCMFSESRILGCKGMTHVSRFCAALDLLHCETRACQQPHTSILKRQGKQLSRDWLRDMQVRAMDY